jgi:hypothetical protein
VGSLSACAGLCDEQDDEEYLDYFIYVANGGAGAAGYDEPEDDGQRRVSDENPAYGAPVRGQLGDRQKEGGQKSQVAKAV